MKIQKLDFFPESITKYEKVFRTGLMLLVGDFTALAMVLLITIVYGDISTADKALSDPFFNYSVMVIMLVFILLLEILFIFCLVRLIVTLIKGKFKIALGYFIYLVPLTLFMLPMFFGLYDSYRHFGKFF